MRLCPLICMFVSLSSLAADTDNQTSLTATQTAPRLNLYPPYLVNLKSIERLEMKNLPEKSQSKVVILAANVGYEKGWNNATKTYMFTDEVGLGSMRNNTDIGPGLGLGIKLSNGTMLWGAAIRRPEGGLMPAIAINFPLRGF